MLILEVGSWYEDEVGTTVRIVDRLYGMYTGETRDEFGYFGNVYFKDGSGADPTIPDLVREVDPPKYKP